jgi:integrase
MQALSVEECRRFLDVARQIDHFALFALALTTGMRPSEYLALKWSDIDWQRGTASVCRTVQFWHSGWRFDDTKRRRGWRIVKLHEFVLQSLKSKRETETEVRDSTVPDGP